MDDDKQFEKVCGELEAFNSKYGYCDIATKQWLEIMGLQFKICELEQFITPTKT